MDRLPSGTANAHHFSIALHGNGSNQIASLLPDPQIIGPQRDVYRRQEMIHEHEKRLRPIPELMLPTKEAINIFLSTPVLPDESWLRRFPTRKLPPLHVNEQSRLWTWLHDKIETLDRFFFHRRAFAFVHGNVTEPRRPQVSLECQFVVVVFQASIVHCQLSIGVGSAGILQLPMDN